MSNNKDSAFRLQIASIFRKLAEKIEEDEEFAKFLLADIEGFKNLSKIKSAQKPSSKTSNKLNIQMDIFNIYQKSGTEGLLIQLSSLEITELKKVVLNYGLDPAQKVRRWRSKEKITNFIVDAVVKQMSKGDAFLK